MYLRAALFLHREDQRECSRSVPLFAIEDKILVLRTLLFCEPHFRSEAVIFSLLKSARISLTLQPATSCQAQTLRTKTVVYHSHAATPFKGIYLLFYWVARRTRYQ